MFFEIQETVPFFGFWYFDYFCMTVVNMFLCVSFVQDKEVANGGTAPRMLCLDDYFVVEVEKVVTDPETGKKLKKMVLFFVHFLICLLRITCC